MKRVLVTNAYWYPFDAKQWAFRQPYPPLGSLLAAAVLREQGFAVAFHDNNLTDQHLSISAQLARSPQYLVIYDDGFNYLTKMCLTVMRDGAFAMTKEAKQHGCVVIISSSDSSDHYEKYLDQGVDFVVRGEGEETLKQLLEVLEAGADPSAVSGIAFRKNTQTLVTSARPVLKNPDSLPAPAWDLIDIEPYRKIWISSHGYFSLNMATTRGCPYKCNWCAKPIYGNRYNVRSPKRVADELEYLLSRFQPDHFWMSDDIFGLKPGWVREFREEIEQRKLKFTYKIQSRVDLLLESDNLKNLAASGAETIWVGAESGSQKILDAMDKGTTVEQIHEATTLLKAHGIRPAFFLQFGYPGETWEDIQSTLKMVLDLMPDEIGISVSYPLPGTKFYENVKAGIHGKQNWSDSDDLAMMFKGTYIPAFYKVLHRYIHNRYRIQRGIHQLKNWYRTPSLPKQGQVRKVASMLFNLPLSLVHAVQLKKLSKIGAAS